MMNPPLEICGKSSPRHLTGGNFYISDISLHQTKRRGFSLVEVVIALGLVSFSLVSIFGLLSVGFTSSRQSMNRTVEADIAKGILGEAQLTPFAQLTNFQNKTRYYSTEGKFEPQGTATNQFTVTTSLQAPSSLLGTPSGATNLIVKIVNITTPKETNTYSALLVKSE